MPTREGVTEKIFDQRFQRGEGMSFGDELWRKSIMGRGTNQNRSAE